MNTKPTPAVDAAITRRSALCSLCVAAALICGGCGDAGRGGVAVEGRVRLDGQPMPAGSIVFVPSGATSGHKTATEIDSGQFRIDADLGPIPGTYRVEIYAPDDSGAAWDDPQAFAVAGPRYPPPNRVAPRFNTQSELTAIVKPNATNDFEFEVRSTAD